MAPLLLPPQQSSKAPFMSQADSFWRVLSKICYELEAGRFHPTAQPEIGKGPHGEISESGGECKHAPVGAESPPQAMQLRWWLKCQSTSRLFVACCAI